MGGSAQLNFVRQQGFKDSSAATCDFEYPALMWQPRLMGALVLVGLILQAPMLFLALSAVLWWNVALPQLNPFDLLYNRLVADPRGRPRAAPAPGPRRFSQAMAGSFMLGIGLSLLMGWRMAALVLEAFLVIALGALLLGTFCLGSYLFLLITGQARLANATLPWARAE
jgi:hypothetical protein